MTNFGKASADAIFYPLWLDNAAAPAPCCHLIGKAKTDLLIVGGGYSGLWAAIIAKQRNPNRDVMIVEAGKVAHGASGRPGGIVSTSVMHGIANAKRVFPNDVDLLEKLGSENLDSWRKTIEEFEIDAELEWNGEMTVAVRHSDINALRNEYDLHIKHNHHMDWLDRDAVRGELDSPTFHAGIWNRKRTGIVHPAKLAWGLKGAALKLGVILHEHTPMESVEDLTHALKIKTHDGEIIAPKVIFATNAWAAGHKKIKKYVAAFRDRVIATEPLSDEQLDRIGWKNRQGIYDTRKQLNYMRLTADNRIVYGGRIGYYYGGQTDPAHERKRDVYEKLGAYFFRTFPQLGDIKFSHAWSGPIDLTTRFAAHFQPYYDGKAVYAGGYSGFGVTASRFAARLSLDLIDDTGAPDLDLTLARKLPRPIPPEPLRWLGANITIKALDKVDEKGGWRRAWIGLVHALGFPL